MKICGIYALYYEQEALVYIGQSQNIQKRYTEHLLTLKKGIHANYKLLSLYTKYGPPELIILEECSIDQLFDKEALWTKEFNSVKSGLNIVEAGPTGWGVNSSRSKYSKIQVLKVFSLLTKTSLANIDISNKLNVSLRLVEAIRNGYSHIWLKEEYPERYSILTNKNRVKNTVSRKLGKTIQLVNNVTGEIVLVDSVVDFTKIYGNNTTKFASGIRRVIRKEQESYNNWKLGPQEILS